MGSCMFLGYNTDLMIERSLICIKTQKYRRTAHEMIPNNIISDSIEDPKTTVHRMRK